VTACNLIFNENPQYTPDLSISMTEIISQYADTAARQGPGARSATKAWLRALELTAPIAGNPMRTFPVVVEELAERFGDAPALMSEAAFAHCWIAPTVMPAGPGGTGSATAMRSAC
jgi:hypothetical protein